MGFSQSQKDNLAAMATRAQSAVTDLANLIAVTPVDADAPPVVAPPVVVPDPPSSARTPWNTGVWAQHSAAEALEWFKRTKNDYTGANRNVSVFPSRETSDKLLNTWWVGAVPAGCSLAIGIPLVPDNDTDLSKNRDDMFATLARQIAQVDPAAFVRLGWEMNVTGWPWRLTQANAVQWASAFNRAYQAMKSAVPRLRIGFNPNGGDLGDGAILGSVQFLKSIKFDWLGPDQYDCWPGATSQSNISTMLTRPGGLTYWYQKSIEYGVPYAVPEWGVSSGTQWAGHTGGDNPAYISMMRAHFETVERAQRLAFESYFNDDAAYLRSDLLQQNQASSAKYFSLWKQS